MVWGHRQNRVATNRYGAAAMTGRQTGTPAPRHEAQAGFRRLAVYSFRYPTHSPSGDLIQQADFPYPSKWYSPQFSTKSPLSCIPVRGVPGHPHIPSSTGAGFHDRESFRSQAPQPAPLPSPRGP